MRFPVLYRDCGLFILFIVTSVTQKRKNIHRKRARPIDAKNKNKKWLKAGLTLLLLVIVVFRFRDYLWEGFREITRISARGKIGIILASTGYMLMEGMSVSRLSRAFQADIRWRTGTRCAYYCGFVRAVTFGGGAGAAEIYYLSKEGMEPAHAFDTSLIQYLCQKLTVTILGAGSLILLFHRIEDVIGKYKYYFVYGVTAAVFISAAIMLVLLSRRIAELLCRGLDWAGEKKEAWRTKTDQWKRQVMLAQEGVKGMLQKKGIPAEMFVWNTLKYLCWFSVPFLLYGEGDMGFWYTSAGLMAVATVMASVIPVPGGYGALEFVQLLLFSPIIGRAKTVSLVILYRVAATLLPAFIGGGVAAFYKGRDGNSKAHQ